MSTRNSPLNKSTLQRYNPVIVELAQEAGSIKKLAAAMGVHWVRLHQWARGDRLPDFRRLEALGHHKRQNDYVLARTGKTLAEIFQADAGQTKARPIPNDCRPLKRDLSSIEFCADWPKLTARLTARQCAVVAARIKGLSLREIALDFGVTAERIRQIELRAIETLKSTPAVKSYGSKRGVIQ